MNPKVFVLAEDGTPLMPTTASRARRKLRDGQAKVVKREPFTIQLLYKSGMEIQPIKLGIDSGYQNIGFSATTEKDELISGEVKLDNGMSKRIQDKAIYRRNRRNRLRYRQSRFDNRTQKENWLPPSIQRRFDTNISLINKLRSILPISEIIVEAGSFDIQKLQNPEIESKQYQQGEMYGYANLKSYLLTREKSLCQLCGKVHKKWQMHHIIPRSKGGTNRPKNFALLGDKCHDKLHKQNLYHKLKKNRQFKGSTFMSIIRKRFYDFGYNVVYGYQTFVDRNKLSLSKSHANDAFVISGGINQNRVNMFIVTQKRKNNRCLQINRKSGILIRRKRYSIRPKDLVKYSGKMFEVIGIISRGLSVGLTDGIKKIYKSPSKLDDWIFHRKTLIWRNCIGQ